MYKNTKRAERRHHYRRLKQRRIKQNYWGRYDDGFSIGWPKAHLGMAVETPCNCSCPMCGNPRKHFGEKTLAEIRKSNSAADQFADYFENEA